MLITTPEKLQDALKVIHPTHVAVAYLGANWKEYLDDVEQLKEIIISPTLGSNPDALEELLDLTWNQELSVYFLTNLHAKIYIGRESCLIGSANLSYNGFGGGLEEAAIMVFDHTIRGQAMTQFARLRDVAVSDEREQRLMIESLRKQWNRAYWHDVSPNELGGSKGEPTLSDFQLGSRRIHLAWYCDEGIDYRKDSIRAAIPEIHEDDPGHYFQDAANFIERDDVEVGDWLLLWACKKNNQPKKNIRARWMQVNHLIPNGASEESEGAYTLVAAALPDRNHMPAPFALDDKVAVLLRDLLLSDDYPELLGSDDAWWSAKKAWPVAQRFLEALKAEYLAK